MGSRKFCRDAFGFDLVDSSLKLCGVGDVKVVGDAAVLFVKGVEVVVECLKFIAVAEIICRKAEGKIFQGLILIRSFRVDIVDSCAYPDSPVDVPGKIRP